MLSREASDIINDMTSDRTRCAGALSSGLCDFGEQWWFRVSGSVALDTRAYCWSTSASSYRLLPPLKEELELEYR